MTSQKWERDVADAQRMMTVRIAGDLYGRVAYGEEHLGWDTSVPCHDCLVAAGQLHVLGCDVEECPKCRGQLITCDCMSLTGDDGEGDDDESDESDDDESDDDGEPGEDSAYADEVRTMASAGRRR